MAFSDVDCLFYANPLKFIPRRLRGFDVWSGDSLKLPRPRRRQKARMYNPRMTHDDLAIYYERAGSGWMADLHLKYKWKLQDTMMCTGNTAIHSTVYSKLIKTWYEMSLEVVDRPDHSKGDQEVFTAAVWCLGLTYKTAPRYFMEHKYCIQYDGHKKGKFLKDFMKLCRRKNKIARQR